MSAAPDTDEPRRIGTMAHARLPLALFGVFAIVAVATLWNPPAGRTSWMLEVMPGLIPALILAATFRRFPMAHLVYALAFLHLCILVYGGYYTYALTPLGNWPRDTFHLSRNHYDRIGHIALGALPCFAVRELLLRTSPLRRGKWLFFIVTCIIFAFAAFWELMEWWTTLIVAGDVGTAFLGSQGDVWDAQWDMFLALIGVVVALALFSGVHDRGMSRVPRAADR